MAWDTTTFDPGEDTLLWDGAEQITIQRYNRSTDGFGSAVSVFALCREVRQTTVAIGNGETTEVDLVVHINRRDLTFAPRRLDKITRPGDASYNVQVAPIQTLGTRYRLSCTKIPSTTEADVDPDPVISPFTDTITFASGVYYNNGTALASTTYLTPANLYGGEINIAAYGRGGNAPDTGEMLPSPGGGGGAYAAEAGYVATAAQAFTLSMADGHAIFATEGGTTIVKAAAGTALGKAGSSTNCVGTTKFSGASGGGYSDPVGGTGGKSGGPSGDGTGFSGGTGSASIGGDAPSYSGGAGGGGAGFVDGSPGPAVIFISGFTSG